LAEIEAELAEEDQRRHDLKQIQDQLTILSQTHLDKKNLVESYQQQLNALNEQNRQVESIHQQLELTTQNRDSLHQRLQDRIAEKETFTDILEKASEIETTHARYLAIRAELENMDKQLQAYVEVEKRRQIPLAKLNAERIRLQQEAGHLEKFHDQVQVANEQIRSITAERSKTEQELHQVEDKLAQQPDCQLRIQAMQSEIAMRDHENKRLLDEMKELRQRIDHLQIHPLEANCPLCGQPLSVPDREKLIQSLNEQGKGKKEQFNGNKEKINQLQEELKDWQSLNDEFPELEKIARKIIAQIQEHSTHLLTYQEVINIWENEQYPALKTIQNSLAAEDFLPDVRLELSLIEDEIRQLGYDIDHHNELRDLANELRPVEGEMQKLAQARATLTPLEREIGDLHNQVTTIEMERQTLDREYQKSQSTLQQLQAQAPDLERAELELRMIEEQENSVRLELGVAQQKVNVLAEL
jgi:exonuclease SbcC